MEIPTEVGEYGPLVVLVYLVIVFLKDRRATTDRLVAAIVDLRLVLVEVRELIKDRRHGDGSS